MRNATFPDILYKKYSEPEIGIEFTKHFFERYVERYDDPHVFGQVLKYVRENLCMLIYEAESGQTRKRLVVNGEELFLGLVVNVREHRVLSLACPVLVVKTIFKRDKT